MHTCIYTLYRTLASLSVSLSLYSFPSYYISQFPVFSLSLELMHNGARSLSLYVTFSLVVPLLDIPFLLTCRTYLFTLNTCIFPSYSMRALQRERWREEKSSSEILL